jgi:hypothetical protein
VAPSYRHPTRFRHRIRFPNRHFNMPIALRCLGAPFCLDIRHRNGLRHRSGISLSNLIRETKWNFDTPVALHCLVQPVGASPLAVSTADDGSTHRYRSCISLSNLFFESDSIMHGSRTMLWFEYPPTYSAVTRTERNTKQKEKQQTPETFVYSTGINKRPTP